MSFLSVNWYVIYHMSSKTCPLIGDSSVGGATPRFFFFLAIVRWVRLAYLTNGRGGGL